MVSQILAAIAAIPELISSIRELLAFLKKIDDEKWFAKENKLFHETIPQMETTEQFQDAAGQLQDQFRKL